ncbi:MAG TPA: efflux RND transporter periplasmic adaptor subunit [Bryobacteraceae bacterium]|jgi:cobalt-zinc-cadmium efflux system membrane fusion protein|nr:efflux RND transporter periplasmic adaptor subunit [Bryobacteraceae bacterium]
MKRNVAQTLVSAAPRLIGALLLSLTLAVLLVNCGQMKADPKVDLNAEAPPPAEVIPAGGSSLVKVDHPEQFPVVAAGKYDAAPQINVTGTIAPDVSRNVPVISIASGRIVEIHAKLGDVVSKGQLLLRVQSADISGAFSDYRQALADEKLAEAQLARAKILLDAGAMAQKDYEVAVDTEEKAKVTVETTAEHLRVLGADKDHPSPIIDIVAPVSGVITDQQVTQAAGTQGLASPNPFTISDLSHVWILCDVFENQLKNVRIGEYANVTLNAYPDHAWRARIDNIGPILDPNIRTAKVRLEVENPGLMRLGMFVTATFFGDQKQMHALVPATAILHLHDRDWVYVPQQDKSFRRVEVAGGNTLPQNMQEVTGIDPGTQVVKDALVLENTVEQ